MLMRIEFSFSSRSLASQVNISLPRYVYTLQAYVIHVREYIYHKICRNSFLSTFVSFHSMMVTPS